MGLLKQKLGAHSVFTYQDIKSVLKQQDATLKTTLFRLVKNGQIRRTGRALYTFRTTTGRSAILLSQLANDVRNELLQTGYRFFVSGLDVLGTFVEHIPESYPVLLFTERSSLEEVRDVLMRKGMFALAYPATTKYRPFREAAEKELVLIYPTVEFKYAKNGLASLEKAFVDLYYATTREGYPLPIQELARLYLNMESHVDLRRLTKIASRRSIKELAELVDLSLSSKGITELLSFFARHSRATK